MVIWKFFWVLCSSHHSLGFGRWVSIFVHMAVFLIIRERLIGRSPWSPPITTILFFSRRKSEREGVRLLRSWRSSLFKWSISCCMALVFSSWERWLSPSRMAYTSMGSMHTPLLVLSSLKIDKVIFTLGPPGFYLMWTWTHHGWTSDSL